MARDIRYLALDEVIEIHDRAVQEFGGSVELRDWGLLDSCVMTPQQVILIPNCMVQSKRKQRCCFISSFRITPL